MRDTNRLTRNRGVILIGSYLILSLLLIYASGIATSTNTQQLAMDRLSDRSEACRRSSWMA
jgi:hypothetical protein